MEVSSRLMRPRGSVTGVKVSGVDMTAAYGLSRPMPTIEGLDLGIAIKRPAR
jgi:hypothetical protein